MRFPFVMGGLALALFAGVARAQPVSGDPAPSQPGSTTPQNGIARGVIKPDQPVDPKMVTRPRTPVHHTMPVIKPPGTAR